ncbi:hypothetical protein [Paractinoplanes maris]|uniref:hypothetical protein n=1 Tax=Paractinoplanes maris TaxID=1734446 RepID=UPI0020208B28|nr:hypothetical protein [Actinoplanes maris]
MPDATPSFDADIRPLFREKDRDSMIRMFDLWSADDVRAHAESIHAAVSRGSMPCDGPWSEADTALLRRWIDGGSPA